MRYMNTILKRRIVRDGLTDRELSPKMVLSNSLLLADKGIAEVITPTCKTGVVIHLLD